MEAPTFEPIGVVHTGFRERSGTPRQPYVAADAPGTIELYPGRQFEAALSDLDTWSHLWVVFWFHENKGWRPKVLPPRSPGKRRGVFATRSPHRPNPIGLSVLKLDRVVGRVLHVRGVDLLDGTPVLDIKPYVPAADIVPEATMGWLAVDPTPTRVVVWSPRTSEQANWLLSEQGIDLFEPVGRVLALGTHAHPYRRIQRDGDALRLAVKDWRVRFRDLGETVEVTEVLSGYRPAALAPGGDAPAAHHAFVARYDPRYDHAGRTERTREGMEGTRLAGPRAAHAMEGPMGIMDTIKHGAGKILRPVRAGDEKIARNQPGVGVAQTLDVSSPAFGNGQPIPKRHAGDGDNVSPALQWAKPPAGTMEVVLLCEDPDAPLASPFVHWVALRIPPEVTVLPEGITPMASPAGPTGMRQGHNGARKDGYTGPLPPPGHGVHHYHFQVFALDSHLAVPDEGVDRDAVVKALSGHVLASGDLVGTYER